ncbi:dapper homolog 3-like [Paralichthys olivaceus]|uniref:dapper homolog 3-like n=1 Tax=Paralichthys olivaceus TaxID=8255 RepID=UPI0037501CD1
MSLQELPGTFGVVLPTLSLPMEAERSRNKELLEASLAGLCELELLKQRQECRVLSALCLGDSPVPVGPPWGALRSARCALDAPDGNAIQTSSLQCTPWGLKFSLEQQVAELKVNPRQVQSAKPILEDKRLSSGDVLVTRQNGSPESNYQTVIPSSLLVPVGTGETEIRESWQSDTRRQDTFTYDAFGEMRNDDPSQGDYKKAQKVENYIFCLIQRRALPIRPSKTRTSLSHDARVVSVVRQSSVCRKDEQDSPKQVSVQTISSLSQCSEVTALQACQIVDQKCNLGTEFNEEASPLYHNQLLQSVQHQPGFYHKPRQASMVNTSSSTLPDYPSCVQQAKQDSSNSENDSTLIHNYQPAPALSKPHHAPSPDEQLVNAEYIPAQPCRAYTRAYAHYHSNPQKGSGVPKHNRSMFSPERNHHHEEQQPTASQVQPSRCRGGPKKCRLNEERSSAIKRLGKKACRSQSENSLQRVPERKYNTVERDGGGSGSGGRGSRSSQSRSKKKQQGNGSYRRWQSSLDLSQDEADQLPMQAPVPNQRDQCSRRTRKSRSTHVSYVYPHRNHNHQHPSHHHQQMEYQLERDQVPLCKTSEDFLHQDQGESESSMSEADSPDSSSLSSDSDESGGLVWPQQLPPQLSLPSPPAPPGAPLQPKAFVKIKASHALKKKILRFRTGSLKVMTTV